MPVIGGSSSRRARALALGACLFAIAAAPGCAVFGGGGPSLVAQGKYYSSGNPQYDEFFIELYQLQVQMADAPHVTDVERQNLAQALGLSPDTPADGVSQRLREETLKLSQSGVRMRLEQNPSPEKPEAASATIRATSRPKDNPSAALISTVESSATNLLRCASGMKAAAIRLGKLEVAGIGLDADVPKSFAQARMGKQTEVKKNLADAQKLITLMKARGDDVRAQSEQLLAAIAKAVDSDDGSFNAPPAESAPVRADPKKAAPARAKAKAAASVPAAGAKPKPAPTGGSDEDAQAKPAAPSKPAAPPRDFEP